MDETLSHIEVLKPGISSIQDAGRFGYLSQGIPMSGFMDSRAAGLANMLVGNSVDKACIEWAMLSPKLHFIEDAVIAVTGVDVDVYINEIKEVTYKTIYVPKNGVLSFGVVKKGVYGYISIRKGFKTPKVLGSRSWFSQITEHHVFLKGMYIPFVSEKKVVQLNSKLVPKVGYDTKTFLKVFPGPEFYLLNKKQQFVLFNSEFTIGAIKNRMGIQLEESFDTHKLSILSSPVLPGTVQWTPSGNLIILMKDAQTIGGYPRILQLSESSLNELNSSSRILFCISL